MDTRTPRIFFPMADVQGRRSAFEITLDGGGEPLDVAALGVRELPTLWRTMCPGRACPLEPEGDAVVHGIDLDPEVSMRRMGRSGQLAIALLLSNVTTRWESVTSVWATGSIHETGRLDTTLNGVDGKFERFIGWVDAQPHGGRHLFFVPLGRFDVVQASARSHVETLVFDPDVPLRPGTLAPGVHVVLVPETLAALQALLNPAHPGASPRDPTDVKLPARPGRLSRIVIACLFLLIGGITFYPKLREATRSSAGATQPPIEGSNDTSSGTSSRAEGDHDPALAEPAFDVERMGDAVEDLRRQRKAGVVGPDERMNTLLEPDADTNR